MHRTLCGRGQFVHIACRDVMFSISEARRALPYVARVVRDACEAFQTVQECRRALRRRIADESRRRELCIVRDEALIRLNETIDECNMVGVDVVDFARGTVRLNAQINGRLTSLIWRMDEPISEAWRTLVDSSEDSTQVTTANRTKPSLKTGSQNQKPVPQRSAT